MPADTLLIPFGLVLNFGLILCRTTGLLVFLPIPGLRSAFEFHRLVLAVLFAALLLPWAPGNGTGMTSLSGIAKVAASEAALGLGMGLCVAIIQEGVQLGAQLIGLQAGFSYASTIDPTSNADSAILQVLLSLGTSMIFLAMGLDTVLFRFLLQGIQTVPPGTWSLTPQHAGAVLALFPPVFTTAIRYCLPVVAILLVIDTALALLSRLQPQLQLLTLSFPIKMLASIVILAYSTPLLPAVVERAALGSFETLSALLSMGAGGPK